MKKRQRKKNNDREARLWGYKNHKSMALFIFVTGMAKAIKKKLYEPSIASQIIRVH